MRTNLSASLRFLLYGLVLLLVGGTLKFGWAAPQRGNDDEVKRQAKATEMKSYMNESIDPCNNFYEFACGKYAQVHPANNATGGTTGIFERLKERFFNGVQQVLDNEDNVKDSQEDREVRKFYKSCTRLTSIDKTFQEGLKTLIKQFGEMPMLEGDNWKKSNFDWLNTTATINFEYGIKIILAARVSQDHVNNTGNVLQIMEAELLLKTRGMYLSNHTEHFRNLIIKGMAHILERGLGVKEELANKTAKELMDFEIQLAKGLSNDDEELDLKKLYVLRTLDEMHQIYAPILNIKQLVNVTIGEKVRKVYDINPSYKTNLIKVIQKTPKRTLANYIFYRLIHEFYLKPGKTEAKRKENCLDQTMQYFAKNCANMFYRHYNNEIKSSDIEHIWSKLRPTLKHKLQYDSSLNWIGNRTREVAIKKLTAMKIEVNSHADEDLSQEFKLMNMTSNGHFIDYRKELMRVRAYQGRDFSKKPVANPLEELKLSFSPAYSLLTNTISVPISVLQSSILSDASYPNAVKFGSLGMIIGHEMIHGFDSTGRKFDEFGNVNDWWDDESSTHFLNSQRCFTNQYSKYSLNGRLLRKTDQQGENIADNSGLRLAYAAYRRFLEEQDPVSKAGSKEILPTLNYTNNQLFFLSFAQVWCSDMRSELQDLQAEIDEHTPHQFRVIGTLSNSEEFAEAFQCERGTYMNPDNKCKIY